MTLNLQKSQTMTIETIEFLEVKNEDGFLNALILYITIWTLLEFQNKSTILDKTFVDFSTF